MQHVVKLKDFFNPFFQLTNVVYQEYFQINIHRKNSCALYYHVCTVTT
jgi:hypothetical protein